MPSARKGPLSTPRTPQRQAEREAQQQRDHYGAPAARRPHGSNRAIVMIWRETCVNNHKGCGFGGRR